MSTLVLGPQGGASDRAHSQVQRLQAKAHALPLVIQESSHFLKKEKEKEELALRKQLQTAKPPLPLPVTALKAVQI